MMRKVKPEYCGTIHCISRKVKSEYHGIIHCIARCDVCDKDWDSTEVATARRGAKNHTRDTGHDTTVETGTTTKYRLEIIK